MVDREMSFSVGYGSDLLVCPGTEYCLSSIFHGVRQPSPSVSQSPQTSCLFGEYRLPESFERSALLTSSGPVELRRPPTHLLCLYLSGVPVESMVVRSSPSVGKKKVLVSFHTFFGCF